MTQSHDISCDCRAVSIRLSGAPRVRGHCHCQDCRTLLDVPYHSVTAWNPDQLEVTQGGDRLIEFQHPALQMKRVFCAECGETVYNTNAMDWRVVSLHLIAKNNDGEIPDDLAPLSHFHYAARIVSIDDDLPKKD
ncbi:Uncharacterized conserved protein [Paracoccus isoporae]|uniref:Uncharacterized conserved protein n=1 Tax=Paracoccus isoporae TaxID=591205 RepID=A0A1G7AN33_9RHOB|nr:GFA family protein [Paracoccus isoporae]SDE16202.1 Uncharacterized conserved protein [Paracoccus isoporae]